MTRKERLSEKVRQLADLAGRDLRINKIGRKYVYLTEYVAYTPGSPFGRKYTEEDLDRMIDETEIFNEVQEDMKVHHSHKQERDASGQFTSDTPKPNVMRVTDEEKEVIKKYRDYVEEYERPTACKICGFYLLVLNRDGSHSTGCECGQEQFEQMPMENMMNLRREWDRKLAIEQARRAGIDI